MRFHLNASHTRATSASRLPQWDDLQQKAIEDASLQLLGQLHHLGLTEDQRAAMAQGLQEQMAALSVLRRFPLDNDDAPCFTKAPIGTVRDDG